MLGRVRQWFAGGSEKVVVALPEAVRSVAPPVAVQSVIEPAPIPQPGPKHAGEPVPYYPRKGPAVPAVPPHKIIATQQRLIRELRQASALSFDEFDNFILPTIQRYAEFVHLLPASEYDHHSDLGGLFRHGLEVALNASRRAEGKEFALNETPSVRKFQIFRWRACALLGGMLHDLGKAVIDVGASDINGTNIWNPHVQGLWSWLDEHQVEHYTISWRETRRHREHDAISATALLRIIPDETMRWMGEHRGRAAYDAMLMALTASNDRNNPLIDIIKGADGDSVRIDRAEAQKRLASIGEAGSRSSAALLVRAMRERILQGEWQVNELGHPVWNTTQGIFVMHPMAAKQSVEHLREQGLTTIPNDPSLVLGILREAGVITQASLPDGKSYDLHRIRVHAFDRGQPVMLDLTAMKFASDRIIPDYFVLPSALEVDLCDPDGKVMSSGTIKPFEATVAEPAPATLATPAAPAEPPAPSDISEGASDRTPNRSKPGSRPNARGVAKQDSVMPATEPGAEKQVAADDADEDAPYIPPALDVEALLGDDDLLDSVVFESEPLFGSDAGLSPADAPLRDWGNEKDLRPAMVDENVAISKNPFPPTTVEGANHWLERQSKSGYLNLLIGKVQEGTLQWGRDIWEVEEQLAFRYPESVEGCGMDPATVLDTLAEVDWIESDPSRGNLKTIPMKCGQDIVSTIRFTHGVSATLRLLMPAREVPVEAVEDVGPYITGDRARLCRIHPIDSPVGRAVFRTGFYDFLADHFKDTTHGVTGATDVELTALMRRFNKSHGNRPVMAIRQALSIGDNPLARATGKTDITYITEYERGLDEMIIRKVLGTLDN